MINLVADSIASIWNRVPCPKVKSFRVPSPRFAVCLFFLLAGCMTASGQATKVAIIVQPVPGPGNGALMPTQPVVEIKDAADERVTTSIAQVKIVIASGNGGTLGGTTTITAENGVATFTNLTFSGLANEPYVFEFKSEPVIVSEPFAYSGGSLTGNSGGTGWSGAWFGPNGAFPDLSVDGSSLSYPNFSSSGGRAIYTSNIGGDGGRQLAALSNANDDIVWLAFLGNYDQQGGGFNNVRLYLPAGLSAGIGGNGNIYNWTILDNNLGGTAATAYPLDGATRLALLKIDYTAGTSSLWIDPEVTGFNDTQAPSVSVNFAPVFDRIEIYNRYFDVSTDEITLASTYKAALHLEQNLTSSFSIAATLPVKWNYFTAACSGASTLLKWGTASEANNLHFIVERSKDGTSWLAIDSIPSGGSNSVDRQYQFTDSAFSLQMFYRLQQVDVDGRVNFSKIVAVTCESTLKVLHAFPNPASDVLQITGAPVGSRYEVRDVQGKLVRTGMILSGNTTVSLLQLPEGNYFLKVQGSIARPVHVLKVKRN